MWTPDVYQGAPTPVTAFMASATKVAAFGALIRIAYTALAPLEWDMRPALWTMAIATMLVGTFIAVVQRDVVRMLAYSAIAHAGFCLVGVVSFDSLGISGTLFYLLSYALATVGAFGVAAIVRVAADDVPPGEARSFELWRGLGRSNPWLATAMSVFLLAFAGIPLTSGFIGKFAVFAAAFNGGAAPVAIVGILCSCVAAFFYARLIQAMFSQPAAGGRGATRMKTEGLSLLAIAVAAVATIALGVWPAPVLDFASQAAVLLP
jgi:NADH-quinone oxidoreductase subunit N